MEREQWRRMDGMERALALPDGCPAATAGVFLPGGGREAVIGLSNGGVYKWDIRDGGYEKVLDCYPKISAIDMLDGMLLVGAKDGPLVAVDADSYEAETLREWSQSESSRIWKCAWLGAGRAVMTSTYGGIYIYERGDDGSWRHSPLHGHVHSVFAVGVHENLMATGDWSGRIVVWEQRQRNGPYSIASSMHGMGGAVEGLAWADRRTLVGIDASGLVRQFELDPSSGRWATACELDVAMGQGTSIHLADDKRTLLAGTQAEIVQVDLETLHYRTFPIEGAVAFYSKEDAALAVAKDGVYALPIGTIEEPPGTAEYRRIKVSLVGHAGVGKSTLCRTMSQAAPAGGANATAIRPASGRRVWPLKIGGAENRDARQVVLYDHGGQGSALPSTLLQTPGDSDMVLALFSQTDRSTLDIACRSLKIMRAAQWRNGAAARRFLVATHADHEAKDVTDDDMRRAAKDVDASGLLAINALAEDGANDIKKLFYEPGLWISASRVVKSGRARAVEAALNHWRSVEGKPVLDLYDIKSMGYELTGTAIPEAHLDHLLKGMDRRGLLTYCGGIGQVVLDDEDHERVRSGIPMLAKSCNGIVEEGRIGQDYGESRYTAPVLSALKASGFYVKCRDRLVFAHLLRDGRVTVPHIFKGRLQDPMFSETLAFDAESIDAGELIAAAAGLNLPCVDATRTEALFGSEGGAALYYSVSPVGDTFEGPHTQVSYKVGGTRRVFCEALADEFAILARRIGGPRMQQRIRAAPAAGAR